MALSIPCHSCRKYHLPHSPEPTILFLVFSSSSPRRRLLQSSSPPRPPQPPPVPPDLLPMQRGALTCEDIAARRGKDLHSPERRSEDLHPLERRGEDLPP
ncbi:hypothetical protein PVAP13_8NG231301 [Panicum virgatum]|uniref:Uncharacterized protein n=1 Tax=Panicum virgatum TaxID=38727 RepID=A0A8T0PB51_PANVG|nr:hypothetical protein PVAP13_8NG231301 [Panicum virgatum]